MAKLASSFWRVSVIIQLFVEQGCELRTAEPTVQLDDGDCVNTRYLLSPAKDLFVPLVDLTDEDSISELEVQVWERRLGVTIGRPRIQ